MALIALLVALSGLTVKVDTPPANAVAGRPWTVTVRVSRDGRAVRDARVEVVVRGASTYRARATRPGRYRARVVFRSPGRWSWAVRVAGRSYRRGTVSVREAPPSTVEFEQAAGLARTPAGDLIVTDTRGASVYRVDPETGATVRIAGTGVTGFAGDGGPARRAQVDWPRYAAADSDGTLFVAEGPRVRRIDPAGTITTIGTFEPAVAAVALDGRGGLFVLDFANRISHVQLATGATTAYVGAEAGLNAAHGLAVGRDAALYVGDSWNHRIRRIDPVSRAITTVAGTGEGGFSGDGGPALAARFQNPSYLTFAPDGSLVFGDFLNNRVRRIGPDGVITTIAGNGQGGIGAHNRPARQAAIGGPGGVAVDPAGNVYFVAIETRFVQRIDAATGILTYVRPRR